MAAAGVMADFARMPTQRKVIVFGVIGIFLGLIYFKFVYSGLNEDLETAEGEHAQNLDAHAKLERDIPSYTALRDKMVELQKTIDENQKALPTEAEVPAFFETLERKVTESGVEISKWTKKPEEPIDSFVKVPVDIEISGTFMQLKRFFASLVQQSVVALNPTGDEVEERERIVSIENLSLSQPAVRNREIVLSAKFTAVTYRQADQAPAAPSAPSAPATGAAPAGRAAAPTPAAAIPSSPPMPTVGTKVQDAMQKSEDRQNVGSETGSDRLKGGL